MIEVKRRGRRLSFDAVNFASGDSVAAFVQGQWDSRDERRSNFERQWYTNIGNYLGYQYHVYNDYTGKMVLPPAPSWRVRLICNRLMGVVRKTVAKAMRQRPIWTNIPATTDPEDREVSEVSSKLLQNLWRQLQMNKRLVELFHWMGTTGNAFISAVWDPDAGEPLAIGFDDLAELSEEYQTKEYADVARRGVRLGDVRVDVHSPFEIDLDPQALRLEDARYLIHTKVRTRTYLRDRYGSKAGGIEGDGGESNSLTRFYEKRIAALAGPGSGSSLLESDSQDEGVTTHCLWVRPNSALPKGAYAEIAAGRVLLLRKELPNPMLEIPYRHVVEIAVPGRLWGTCSLEQAIPLQAAYNRGRSQLIENANIMGRPKWFNPNGSGTPEIHLNNKPGEVIPYNYPLKPEMGEPPQVPEYLHRNLEYNLKDMEDITAIHEVTQARAPSGVRSGVAIAQLQEQDDQMLAPTFLLVEDALSCVASWLLQYYAHNVEEERIIKIVGDNLDVQSLTFTGSQLVGPNKGKPGVNYFDVRTEMGSQLPLSKSSRKAFIVDLVSSGILNVEVDRKKIHQMLELGTDEGVLQDDQLDRQNQRRENVLMLQGQDPSINPWDQDEVHLEELRRFQKQAQFQRLAAMDPMLIQRFEQHAAMHEMRLQAAMAPPPEAAPGMAMPPPPEEMAPPPPEAGMPQTEEEALAMAQAQGEQIPLELLQQEVMQ